MHFYSVYSQWYYIQLFVCQYRSQYFFSFPDVYYLASLSLSTFLLWNDEKKLFQPVLAGAALHSTLHLNHPSLHLFHLNSFFLLRIVKIFQKTPFQCSIWQQQHFLPSILLSPFHIPYLLHSMSNAAFPDVQEKFTHPAAGSCLCVFPLLSGLRTSQFQQWHLIFH